MTPVNIVCALAAGLLLCGCSTGKGLRCPDRYTAQALSELGDANARMEKCGFSGIGQDPDIQITTRAPERWIDGGWKAWLPYSSKPGDGVWAGGWWVPGKIVIVTEQGTGDARPGRLRHEFCHQIFHDNNFTGDCDDEHAIIKRCVIGPAPAGIGSVEAHWDEW